MLMKTKRGFLHSFGYLNCTSNHISLDLLLILVHARLLNYLNCQPIALLLSKIMLVNTVKKSMKGKNLFWSIKSSCAVISKLKLRGFRAASLLHMIFLYYILP